MDESSIACALQALDQTTIQGLLEACENALEVADHERWLEGSVVTCEHVSSAVMQLGSVVAAEIWRRKLLPVRRKANRLTLFDPKPEDKEEN